MTAEESSQRIPSTQARMYRRRGVALLIGLVLPSVLQSHCTLGRGISTPQERAKAIRIARLLEREPLAEDAPANRQWLLDWIIGVPDIRFKSCVGLLSPGVGAPYRYSSEVRQQIIFSAAAFRLEHPDHLRDDAGAYREGVEGALRVYQVLLRAAPDTRLTLLDDLIAKRDQGELADHVAGLARERCKRPKAELIMNVAGAGVGLGLALLLARWFGRRRDSRVTGVRDATIRRRIVFLCAAYYVAALIALHILQPAFDPRFTFMSAYALGRHGWLMTTTFFVLGLAAFAVALGLRDVSLAPWTARAGLGLLLVGGLFVCLAGVFRDSLPHLLAGVVVFPSIVMAVLLLSWTFRQAAGWRPIYRVTIFIALGMLAMFALMVADIGMPGLQQRAFIALFLAWLSVVAHRLARVAGGAHPADEQG